MFEDNSKNIRAISEFESQISFRHSRFRSATHSVSLNFIYKYKDCQNLSFILLCITAASYADTELGWQPKIQDREFLVLFVLFYYYFLNIYALFFFSFTGMFTDLNYYSVFVRIVEI